MAIRFDRPYSHAAKWARRFGLFGLILFVAAVIAHRFGPLVTPHFVVLLLLSGVTALLGMLLAAAGLFSLWQYGAKGGKASFVAILAGLLPLITIASGAYAFFTKPSLYDVSTDWNPPISFLVAETASQYPLPDRAPVNSGDFAIQQKAYPFLSGRRYEGAMDRVLIGVREVANERRFKIIKEWGLQNLEPDLEDMPTKAEADTEAAKEEAPKVPVPQLRPSTDELEADSLLPEGQDVFLQGEYRSLVLGLESDLIIRLREEAETTLVDIRVAARYGQHDLGFSAAIADEYLRALDAKLLGIAGD